MNRIIRRIRGASDEGSALVVAIAISVVGLALSTVVVSQAIVVMNSSARDRLRTVEIHAAEAALDGAFKVLETETPCDTAMTVGDGASAVDVTVHIDYFNAGGAVTCTDGTLSAVPTSAKVTANAVPETAPAVGVASQRQIESTVVLVPQTAPSKGAAVFAGGGLGASNSGIIEPLDASEAAQVWIEGGNWICSNSYYINGDVIVTSGSMQVDNSCHITGDVWVKSGYTGTGNSRIDGDVTVYAGNAAGYNSHTIGGDVSVGGNIPDLWNWERINVLGTVCANNLTPCASIPNVPARGLPEVDYYPADWGYPNVKDLAGFQQDLLLNNPGLSTKAKNRINTNPCALDNSINIPLKFPTTNTIYDLRACQTQGGAFKTSNTITFVMRADVAFFSNSFITSNKLLIQSGDGAKHQVWFIVPDGGTEGNGIAECTPRGTYTPNKIEFSNTTDIQSPMQLFAYTPCDANISNSTSIIGQIYGKKITTSNSFHLKYTGMGIPGVDLGGPPVMVAAGYAVEIVNKHEIRN